MYSMPTNLLKDTGNLTEDFEDVNDWTANHGSAANDAVNYKTGTQGIKVTSDVGDEGEIQINGMSWGPIGDREVRFWFHIADVSLIAGGSAKIQFYDARGYGVRKEVIHYFYEGWNLVKIAPDDWSVQGAGSLDDEITYCRFRFVGAGGVQGVITYDSLYFDQVSEPAVVLSLDDAHETAYDIAYPILKARNMVATEYVVTDDVGGGAKMTWAELVELQAAGWTIANHSKTHANFTTLTEAEIETELTDAKDALIANGITGNGPLHVAYPGGGWDADTLKAMADTSMLTGRTVTQPARHPALPMDRPHEIPIWFDLDNGTSLATAKTKIDSLVAEGKIGYFYGHAFAGAAGAQTWATSDFIELCNYIAQKRMLSLTIEDAYQLQSGSRMVRRAG